MKNNIEIIIDHLIATDPTFNPLDFSCHDIHKGIHQIYKLDPPHPQYKKLFAADNPNYQPNYISSVLHNLCHHTKKPKFIELIKVQGQRLRYALIKH